MSPPNRAPKPVPARRKDEVNPYLRTKVMTASPAELRLMLLDGAVRFAEEAHAGVTAKDYERSYEGFSRSQAIVMELIASLNHAVDPDLCAQLSGLYTYIYNRLLTGKGEVLIRGRRARVAGTVCMDWILVDVTEIPGVQVGDRVTLLGRDGDQCITAKEWADKIGTITYEVFCNVSKRVPRIFVRSEE